VTLCSVCGQIAATVPCYDGAPRCLPCAAAEGFEWRPTDPTPADGDPSLVGAEEEDDPLGQP
jgi:hypothetical protein